MKKMVRVFLPLEAQSTIALREEQFLDSARLSLRMYVLCGKVMRISQKSESWDFNSIQIFKNSHKNYQAEN